VKLYPQPQSILEAAQLVVQATNSTDAHRHMPHSEIPLIVHQTWGHRRIDMWSEDLRQSAERWLEYVVKGGMAYFLWEDEGMALFMDHYASELHEQYSSLASMVEKTDVFRILVAKCVGGIVRCVIVLGVYFTPFKANLLLVWRSRCRTAQGPRPMDHIRLCFAMD
jgi:mannosyltransferase OCH1-like enzyme